MKLCNYVILSPQACLSIGANLQHWPLFVSLRSPQMYCVFHRVTYYTDLFLVFYQFEFVFMFLSTLITLLILRGRKEEKKIYFHNFQVIFIRPNYRIYMVLNFFWACLNFTLQRPLQQQQNYHLCTIGLFYTGKRDKIPNIRDLFDPF